jgi:hypothetical protein
MTEDAGKYLTMTALTLAGALGGWTSLTCIRARRRGVPAADAVVWAGVSLVYLGLGLIKFARVMGLLHGLGIWLREQARAHHLYANRRPLQIAASLVVAAVVALLLAYGVASLWAYVKRYRMAIGFAGLALGFALIRFISLHEVDAWNVALPWLRVVVELTASVGAASVALARVGQLRAKDQPPGPGRR